MSDHNESLIRRIQKLLALANHNSNEAEASSAMMKVQELLAAHGLEMAEVQARKVNGVGQAEGSPEARTKSSLDFSAMYQFQRDLMSSVAKNNFCFHFIDEREKKDPRARYGVRKVKTHVLVGSHVNVTVATMLYEYLIQTMDRLLPWQGMDKRGKDALLWLAGCSDRLRTRMEDQRAAQERESARHAREAATAARHPGAAPSGALVILADVYGSEADLNTDHMEGLEPGTTAQQRRDREARQAIWMAEWEKNRPEREAANVIAMAEHNARLAELAVKLAKPETEAQKRKRERSEAHWRNQRSAKQAKFDAKYRSTAYRMGSETGQDIGLDTQVSEERKRRL